MTLTTYPTRFSCILYETENDLKQLKKKNRENAIVKSIPLNRPAMNIYRVLGPKAKNFSFFFFRTLLNVYKLKRYSYDL